MTFFFLFEGPAFAPIGITQDVYLEGINTVTPPLQLDSINVISQSLTTKEWQVDAQLSGGSNTTTYTFDFQLKNTSWSFSTSVIFNQKTTISLFIMNDNVQPWWPNGHGDQPLSGLPNRNFRNQEFKEKNQEFFRRIFLPNQEENQEVFFESLRAIK